MIYTKYIGETSTRNNILVGTKIKKDRKIINVQEMTLDKTLLRELRDRLNKMSLD